MEIDDEDNDNENNKLGCHKWSCKDRLLNVKIQLSNHQLTVFSSQTQTLQATCSYGCSATTSMHQWNSCLISLQYLST